VSKNRVCLLAAILSIEFGTTSNSGKWASEETSHVRNHRTWC
jgi:hypothetical protein